MEKRLVIHDEAWMFCQEVIEYYRKQEAEKPKTRVVKILNEAGEVIDEYIGVDRY